MAAETGAINATKIATMAMISPADMLDIMSSAGTWKEQIEAYIVG